MQWPITKLGDVEKSGGECCKLEGLHWAEDLVIGKLSIKCQKTNGEKRKGHQDETKIAWWVSINNKVAEIELWTAERG